MLELLGVTCCSHIEDVTFAVGVEYVVDMNLLLVGTIFQKFGCHLLAWGEFPITKYNPQYHNTKKLAQKNLTNIIQKQLKQSFKVQQFLIMRNNHHNSQVTKTHIDIEIRTEPCIIAHV